MQNDQCKMKPYIAVNAAALVKKHKTGVEWYTGQLLKYLSQEWQDSDPPVVLFVPGNSGKVANFQNKNWRIKSLPGKFLWTQYCLLKFLKRRPPALLFSPSYVPPKFLPDNIPTVTVVHGLEGEYYPEFKTVKQIIAEYLWVSPLLKRSRMARYASTIIAVSEHTKKDLNYFYHIPPEKIKTVLSGPGTLNDNRAGTRRAAFPRKDNRIINFIFLDGSSERKNLALAIKIFLKTKKNVETLHATSLLRMYVTGRIKDKRIKKTLRRQNDIHLLGYVSESKKRALLKSAHFLLYPSFYEGFGFPVLEAQAFGAVPIVLKGSGLKEISGPGVIEIDPSSKKDSLVLELVKVINNPIEYKKVQKMGRENVKRFSWRQCARQVRKILLGFKT